MSEIKGEFRIHFIAKAKDEMTAEDLQDFRNETHDRLDLAIDEIFAATPDPIQSAEPSPQSPG